MSLLRARTAPGSLPLAFLSATAFVASSSNFLPALSCFAMALASSSRANRTDCSFHSWTFCL